MTALEKLGAFVAMQYVPNEPACADARLHAADAIGAWIAATATKEGRLLLGFRQPGATLPDQVAINCALARLSEVDDIHLGSMVTPGAIVVPAALTIAAAMPGPREGRARRRDHRRLRGDDPARRRNRRAVGALSRHLADLFRGAVRRGRDRGAR